MLGRQDLAAAGHHRSESTLDPAVTFVEPREDDNTRLIRVVAPPVSGG